MPEKNTNTRTEVSYTFDELQGLLGLEDKPIAIFVENGTVVVVTASTYV